MYNCIQPKPRRMETKWRLDTRLKNHWDACEGGGGGEEASYSETFVARHASAYEILKSTVFHKDFGFQNGFLDFKVDFWISSGFLDFI